MTRRTDIKDYVAGDSLTLGFSIQNPSGSGQLDLTGATIKFGLSAFDTGVIAAATSLEKTSSAGDIVVTDAEGGLCEVAIDAGDIPTAGSYWYELEVITAGGASYTVSQGRLFAEPAIYPST